MPYLVAGHGHIVRKGDTNTTPLQTKTSSGDLKDLGEMGIRQLGDGGTTGLGICTYLLWDKETEDAVLINPVDTEIARDSLLAMSLHVVYAVNSHGLDKIDQDHHVSNGTQRLKDKIKGLKVIRTSKSDDELTAEIADDFNLLHYADILVQDGDEIHFGNRFITAIATPSPQTSGGMAFLLDDKKAVLTSSALLRPGIGRCDVPATELLHLYALPDETIVFPGYCHDTVEHPEPRSSTIGQEKKNNPLLSAAIMGTEEPGITKKLPSVWGHTRVKENWGLFG